ncbi:BMP family ABC transporter substrate-binding protein [Aminipila butyrica]|uniref:BMP family ABC transporter substrate-binding protein n=1 Tax=Aminipila butyrica TaxID=433296 RepID=A0A858BTJ1_9FIRM|nr:BMP family ABC transporter substrate-binding protein [Aminipila butyrica]QIB68415.1 BMP family ABC transporter substrate-binding protein [Aminipila butyrica]
MKKFFAILLAFVMVFGLAACGGSDTTDEDAATDALKVGFIYIGSINDGGYTQAQHAGTVAMEKYFKGKVKTLYQENVSDSDKSAAMTAAINLMDQGCTVIVGTSYGFMDALDELANSDEYKDIKFLHFSGNKMNDTNFGNYFGATEEPRYLTGIIAGMMTETNKLGYVGAYPYTEVQIGINAFTLGAQSVNPDVEVKVVYINSWYDPEKERSAADELLAQGCDIITQHCDTTGPQVAAAESGKYAIGYNVDNSQVEAVKPAYLTSAIWHHEKFLIPTVEKILAGTWTPESYYGTMADGYMDIAPMTDLVPADVQTKVNEVRDQMIAGEFHPFSGEIYYNDGKVLCEEGQTLDRAAIWSINGLVKGAKGNN